MSDLIDRQAAIDALEKIDCSDGVGISSLKCNAVDDAVIAIKALPSAQTEPAIPLSWIEWQIEWLKSLDNDFSNLTAGQISAMVNKWKDEQNERSD